MVGGLAAFVVADRIDSGVAGIPVSLPQSGSELPPLREGSVAAIAAEALPTVVSLAVQGGGQAATGSGIVLRADGYVLTNNHVIAGAADGGRITVVFNDGESARGRIVGRSQSYDLGVVKVDRRGLPPTPLGNSDAVRVGDPVVAIGSPLGLNGTVTTGIVSALDRPVTAGGDGEESFISALQTDAAINPGNSGGPLLDAEGRVIGINSAIAAVADRTEAGSIGLGFAIPVNQAKRISEEIISTGTSRTPVIGVTLDTRFNGPGAKVDEVTPGGPSDGGRLRPGDVIVGVDGRRIADATELVVAIRSQAPGDEVVLQVQGKGDVTVTLGTADE
jgi:putative serine protease PepD